MLKCLKCGRQTEKNEPTGYFVTKRSIREYNLKKRRFEDKGNKIISSVQTCMKCSGEKIL